MAIKCVVWDLDNTLWQGVLLEGDEICPRPGVGETLQRLDEWGILHSIASHNDEAKALETLERFGLRGYFLAPQINFDPKPEQISAIAQALDLRLEDLAYVDDDPFQRAQVAALLPQVAVLTEEEGVGLANRTDLRPGHVTAEARSRRSFYQSRIARQQAETSFAGSRVEFLKSCRLRLVLRLAQPADAPRVYELIQRTNQLNAAAQRCPLEEVQAWILGGSAEGQYGGSTEVWVGELADRFGEYGVVGVAAIQTEPSPWLVKVLLVSCRAMGRGVGEGLLTYAMGRAKVAGQVSLQAVYRQTPYNAAMRLLLVTHGFRPLKSSPDLTPGDAEIQAYSSDLRGQIPGAPSWLEVIRG